MHSRHSKIELALQLTIGGNLVGFFRGGVIGVG